MIKCAILFDAVGTLIVPRESVVETYYRVAESHGSKLDRDAIRTHFRQAMKQDAEKSLTGATEARISANRIPSTSEETERRRWKGIVASSFVDIPESVDMAFEELWAYFSHPSSWRVYEDVVESLELLKQESIQIGIASNLDSRLHSVLSGFPELERISLRFISSELGYPKPHPGFYEEIESRLGLSQSQIVMIGDDLENDFAAPSRHGWQAHHLDRSTHSLATLVRKCVR